jgi:adenine deaminase
MQIDLVVRGGRVFDAFSGCFRRADVAIAGGRFVALSPDARPHVEINASGAYIVPGLIDTHVHMESSHLTPSEFAAAVVPHGTTAVIADPHEIANVLGLDGVRFMLQATAGLPLRAYFMAPSCVPSSPFESAGGRLGVEEIREALRWDRVLGLGEVMNYPGLLAGDPELRAKISAAQGRPIDGHAPGLTGPALAAYVAAGPRTDHESTRLDEAREKLAAGMHILLREGSAARNLDPLLPILNERTAPFVHFCTDDRNAESLLRYGHIDGMLRRAGAAGVPIEVALAAATLHAARAYGLSDLGAIAPGYLADFAIVSNLPSFEVREVYLGGQRVASEGSCVAVGSETIAPEAADTIRIEVGLESFRIPAAPANASVRVIGVAADQILTETLLESPTTREGNITADPGRDLLLAAVIERHHGTGRIGRGLVRGFGLRSGAIGSSVAHDAHNLVVVGTSPEAMRLAAEAIARLGGGQVVVDDGRVLASLPLPVAGLMSARPVDEVAAAEASLREAAHGLGCSLPEPFMTLSFLALPVIPHLKLTDRGLVDVDAFELVSLYPE